MIFNVGNTLTLVTVIANLILGSLVLLSNPKKLAHISFALFSFITSAWAFSNFIFQIDPSLFIIKTQYALGAAMIPAAFLWIFPLLEKRLISIKVFILSAISMIVVFLPYIDGLVIKGLHINYQSVPVLTTGYLFDYYSVLILVFYIALIYEIVSGIRKYNDVRKTQLKYILLGSLLFGGTSMLVNFILPFFNIVLVAAYDAQSSIFFVTFSAYAILKYKLFNIKVIATELFAIAICLILLVKFLLSAGFYDYLVNGGMLVVAGVFGILLVRSVIHEVEQKNKIEAMAGDVKKAYEVEKKAKEELERLDEAKSQFMMATQHHLRTPLTALKGYLSMTMDGDFGPINDTVKEKLASCFDSTNRLIKLVNEFLDISKLQLGRDILDIKETSITEMLRDIIVEVKPEADKKGIYLTLTLPPEPAPSVMADAGKLREALYNLIDNAVKYTEKGGVKVELQFVKKGKNNCAMIIVADTGIGMTKQEADDVFGRQFERGKEAKKVYALGRGIGLFITASIIKAHKGKIWAESLGAGQGSAFYVELVVKQ